MADAKKRVGRPATSNKAAKCPGKNSGTDEASEESPVIYCPCLDYLDGELSIVWKLQTILAFMLCRVTGFG